MQMDARIILAGQQPDFANALAGGVQAGQAVRQAQQQNALADLFKTQGAGIMSGDQNALNALAQISPQAAFGIMDSRQQMDARSLDMQATRQRMDILTAQEARSVEEYARTKTAAERAAEAAQIEEATRQAMMAQTPEQWDQFVAPVAPDLVGQFGNRDAVAAKYMTMAEILKQTQGDPAAVTTGAPTGYMWTDPNDRTKGVTPIAGYQAEAKDDYQRYVQEEMQAGRKPLGRLDFEQAKKGKDYSAVTAGAPKGYMWTDPNDRGAGVTAIPGYQQQGDRYKVIGDRLVDVGAEGGPKPVDLGAGGPPTYDVKDLDKFRNEFSSLPAVKSFATQTEAYSRIAAAAQDPSAAGDLALIFSYMKMLDPGSVVREGEFANAQNAAGIPERVQAMYNNVLRGERLTENTRADFLGRANKIYDGAERDFTALETQFASISDDRGYPRNQALIDFRYSGPRLTIPQAPPTPPADPSVVAPPSGQRLRYNPSTGDFE